MERWCNADNNVIDPIVLMPRLKGSRPTAPASYGIINVEALLNGALLIPNGDIFYPDHDSRKHVNIIKKSTCTNRK
jgi:hypothetical protein